MTATWHIFVVSDKMASMPAQCNLPKNRILMIFIPRTGLCHKEYAIMLPVYIYHKASTFFYKTGLFYVFMSHNLRIPIQS